MNLIKITTGLRNIYPENPPKRPMSGLALVLLLLILFMGTRNCNPFVPVQRPEKVLVLDCGGMYDLEQGDVDIVTDVDTTKAEEVPVRTKRKRPVAPVPCDPGKGAITASELRAMFEKALEEHWHVETQLVRASYSKKAERAFDDRGNMIVTKAWMMKFAPDACVEEILHGVPATVTLAQAWLESYMGLSNLGLSTKNMFGNKYWKKVFDRDAAASKKWLGKHRKGSEQKFDDTPKDRFVVFDGYWASIRFHTKFLSEKKYAYLKGRNFQGWAYGLKAEGYATDRTYPEKLLGTYKKLKLNEVDAIVRQMKLKLRD